MEALFKSGRDRDEAIMTELVRYTARSFRTPQPVPFGAAIVDTESGELFYRARNAVMRENDPSSHAELRSVRLAAKKLGNPSLRGYTLYSTCEPCAMCMANALWAGLDRVVYGATIEDANRHCQQIQISASEIAKRSDMDCVVEGEVLRDLCYTLFTDPRMLEAFAQWSTRRATRNGKQG
jgi:tRNA(Arg) A34 adenosine deaminase TadA